MKNKKFWEIPDLMQSQKSKVNNTPIALQEVLLMCLVILYNHHSSIYCRISASKVCILWHFSCFLRKPNRNFSKKICPKLSAYHRRYRVQFLQHFDCLSSPFCVFLCASSGVKCFPLYNDIHAVYFCVNSASIL